MQMVPVTPQGAFNAQMMMTLPMGGCQHHHHGCGCKKKHKKKKKKEESDSSDSDSDYEDEYYLVQSGSGRPYTYGDVQKAVVDKYGAAPKVIKVGDREMVPVPSAGGGGGGGRKVDMFAPSHPQAVNQFVRDYNYRAQQDGWKRDLQRYKQSLTQYQDRLSALENYVADQYSYDNYPYDYGFPDDYGYNGYNNQFDNYDPYMDSGYY